MSLGDYWAPGYFTPYYFPQPASAITSTSLETNPGYRDRDAYSAIAANLRATQAFASVQIGQASERTSFSPEQLPLALIVPGEWVEIDDVDPAVNLRRVGFSLILWVREQSAERRFQALDRLTSIAQNAVDGSDLNGGCLRALTKLGRGSFDTKSRFPEQRVTMKGSFSYLVITQTGHDTTD